MRIVNIEIEDVDYISFNKIYAGSHWSTRKKLADSWHQYIFYKFKKEYPDFKMFDGKVRAKMIFHKMGRIMDIDNFSMMVKLILDGFKGLAYKDDNVIYKLTMERGIEKINKIEVFLIKP